MKFDLNKSMEVLSNTPSVLDSLLHNLSDEWLYSNEGNDSWSPFDIVGHLVHGEKTDWIERTKIILSSKDKHFKKFDRFAQFNTSKGKTINDLLAEFRKLRQTNIVSILDLDLKEDMFELKGIHPAFGDVTLRQLLSSWVVHDLNHIAQIARVISKQYKDETGPWIEYLPLLTK